jgi:hypothetical protein
VQPWLYSAKADSVFILAPAFVVTLGAALCASWFQAPETTSPLMWLMLVVGVDVAHVYSTLYRTYLDRGEAGRYRGLLTGIPIACWVGGVMLYAAGRMTFWHVLAYLAVFHFVRQQYGFLRLYARREEQTLLRRRVEGAAIYLATLYPLIYWHTHPRHFSWFLEGDFFRLPFPAIERVALAAYVTALGAYVVLNVRERCGNWPKHLVLAGTVVSWYTGIVVYDGDLVFTATNVVAHGVPYMALVWFYERKKSRGRGGFFRPGMVPIYLGILVVVAYLEEGLWDALVWRDHTQFYQWLAFLPQIHEPALLALLVPLLAVPQATHYVLDGFIWRLRSGGLPQGSAARNVSMFSGLM